MSALFPLSPFSPFRVVAAQKQHLKHKHMIGSLWCLLSIWDWLIVQSFHVIACTWFSRRKIGPEWLCCLHRHSFSLRRSQRCHSLQWCSQFVWLFLSLSPYWNGIWLHHVLYFQQSCWAPGPPLASGQWQVASPTSLTPSRGSNQGLCGARHPDTTVTVKSGVELTWQRGDTSACGTGAVRQPRGQRSQDSKPLIKEMGLTWEEVRSHIQVRTSLSLSLSD